MGAPKGREEVSARDYVGLRRVQNVSRRSRVAHVESVGYQSGARGSRGASALGRSGLSRTGQRRRRAATVAPRRVPRSRAGLQRRANGAARSATREGSRRRSRFDRASGARREGGGRRGVPAPRRARAGAHRIETGSRPRSQNGRRGSRPSAARGGAPPRGGHPRRGGGRTGAPPHRTGAGSAFVRSHRSCVAGRRTPTGAERRGGQAGHHRARGRPGLVGGCTCWRRTQRGAY